MTPSRSGKPTNQCRSRKTFTLRRTAITPSILQPRPRTTAAPYDRHMGVKAKVPWDRRLTDRWARQAEEAANDPQRFRRSTREEMRSPAYWIGLLSVAGVYAVIWSGAPAWVIAGPAMLYVVSVVGKRRSQ
jgi:hypothetical protein